MKWTNVEKKCRQKKNNKNIFSNKLQFGIFNRENEHEKENKATELNWFHFISFRFVSLFFKARAVKFNAGHTIRYEKFKVHKEKQRSWCSGVNCMYPEPKEKAITLTARKHSPTLHQLPNFQRAKWRSSLHKVFYKIVQFSVLFKVNGTKQS